MIRMPNLPKLNPAEADIAYAAAQCVVQTHQKLANFIKAGMTLAHIDAEVARVLRDLKCRSCFLGYRIGRLPAFPSHACLSVNDCIVHGTVGSYLKPLVPGDLLKLDIGVWFNGMIGDAAWTYAIKEVRDEDRRLMGSGKESLRRGILAMQPGARYLDFARAVQGHVEGECGFACTKGLGGHGIGRKLHGPPFVSNIVPGYAGEWAEALHTWEPGVLVAVEPMVNAGTGETRQGANQWPIHTRDGRNSVHYEADVLITASGPKNLTEGMEDLPDIVG